MNNNLENKFSIENMRKLYSFYSPLRTSEDLSNCLSQTINYDIANSDIVSSVHTLYNELLTKFYPNEAAIKSAFSNQYFFTTDKHVSIYELNAGSSRVDMCKVNGTSIAYEIKTDYDNFNRLDKQLNDYMQIFEKIYVICSKKRLPEIKPYLPDICGIYSYTQTRTHQIRFHKERNAQLNPDICSPAQLDLFTKAEFILYFNCPKDLSRAKMKSFVLEHFSDTAINAAFKEAIKSKYRKNWTFLYQNHQKILEIDYQWFFQNEINPDLVYR